MPVVALHVQRIKGLPVVAVVVISVAAAPIVEVSVENYVVINGDIAGAVIGINAVSGAKLVTNDGGVNLLALAQLRPGEALGVNAAAIGQQQHVIEDQAVPEGVLL